MIIDLLKAQTVSDHVYRTQILAVHLIQKLNLCLDEREIVYNILFHDIEEGETGDMPSTHKTAKGSLPPSETLERAVLRLADTVEAAIWLVRYAINPHRVRRYLESKIAFLEVEVENMSGVPLAMISETVSNLIDTGRSHD